MDSKRYKLSAINEAGNFFYCLSDETSNVIKSGAFHYGDEEYPDLSTIRSHLQPEINVNILIHKLNWASNCYSSLTLMETPVETEIQERITQLLSGKSSKKMQLVSESIDDFKVLFPIHQNLLYDLKTQFEQIKLLHFETALARQANKNGFNGCFVHQHGEKLYIHAKKDSKSLFSGSFAADTELAKLYYLMRIFQYFGFDENNDIVSLAGDFNKEGKFFNILSRYISNISFVSAPESFDRTSNIPPLLKYALYCVSECG